MLRMWWAPSRSHGIRTAWLLMVIPRSRSMSIRSRYCARMARSSTTPVICSMRSARVDLPWSMWAMMQKLRIASGGVACGCSTVRARGDTSGGVPCVDDGQGLAPSLPRERWESGPVPRLPPSQVPEVDYLVTSVRPTFGALPDAVRLLLEDGREVFAKAGGAGLPHVLEALAQEAAILPQLSALRCPTRLMGAGEVLVDGVRWRLLVLDVVHGRQPGGPWTQADADATVRTCVEIASTPAEVVERVTSTPLALDLALEGGAHATLADLAVGGRAWPSGIPRAARPGPREL